MFMCFCFFILEILRCVLGSLNKLSSFRVQPELLCFPHRPFFLCLLFCQWIPIFLFVCPSTLCKQGACIIRLEEATVSEIMHWLPTAAAEPHHVIHLCYIRSVWMNNEECLSLQNIPASLPCVLLLAQTGSRWASGTGAVGREGGGMRKHRADWGETGAPLTLAFLSLFWKGRFICRESYPAVLELHHTVQIFMFF